MDIEFTSIESCFLGADAQFPRIRITEISVGLHHWESNFEIKVRKDWVIGYQHWVFGYQVLSAVLKYRSQTLTLLI